MSSLDQPKSPESPKPLTDRLDLSPGETAAPDEKRVAKRGETQKKLTLAERLDQTTLRIDRVLGQMKDKEGKTLTPADIDRIDPTALMDLELQMENRGLLAALFLKKEGQPPVFLEDYERLGTNVEQEFSPGSEFQVHFQNNRRAERTIGAGDMLPAQVRTIMVRSNDGEERIGTRRSSPRVGYYDKDGYMPVFTGDTIIIPTEEMIRSFEEKSGMTFAEDFRKVFRTREEVEAVREEEADSKRGFIDRVRSVIEKADKDFLGYINLEFKNEFGGNLESIDTDRPASAAEKEEIGLKMGLDSHELSVLQRLFEAIATQESSGKYEAVGTQILGGSYFGECAIGRYQIMPTNWRNWSKELAGEVLLPTAANQDLVAFMKMAEYMRNFRRLNDRDRIQMVAASWFGFGDRPAAQTPDELSSRRYYGMSPKKYASDVLGHYDNLELLS